MGHKGINTLCKYLSWNTNISTLNLSTNSINNEELLFLVEELKDNKTLENLDLSMNRFDSLILTELCEMIETTCIKTISFKDNNIGRKGAIQIAKILFPDTSKSNIRS